MSTNVQLTLQQRAEPFGYHSLLAYARYAGFVSLFKCAWRLGAGEVSVADVARATLEECKTQAEVRNAAYVLLVGSVNDVRLRYLSGESEVQKVILRTLVAWQYFVDKFVSADYPERVVNALVVELQKPDCGRVRQQTRVIRRVFVDYWPEQPEPPTRP